MRRYIRRRRRDDREVEEGQDVGQRQSEDEFPPVGPGIALLLANEAPVVTLRLNRLRFGVSAVGKGSLRGSGLRIVRRRPLWLAMWTSRFGVLGQAASFLI